MLTILFHLTVRHKLVVLRVQPARTARGLKVKAARAEIAVIGQLVEAVAPYPGEQRMP